MKRLKLFTTCAMIIFASQAASGAPVILNEYNAVSGSNQLDDGDGVDSFFGTIDGNGGNWFELLVVDDHVDMRGWQFAWSEDEDVGQNETAMGTITLSNDSIWSDLRSGSLLTLIETANGGGNNKTRTDISYDPLAGDWWINVATQEEQGKGASALATTTTNDGNAGDFSVGNDDWEVTIKNASGNTVFGPAGEGIGNAWAGDPVNNEEGGSLEGPIAAAGSTLSVADWQAITPSNEFYDDTSSTSFGAANVDYDGDNMVFETIQDLSALRDQVKPPGEGAGDFDNDGLLTAKDIDELALAIRDMSNDLKYDLDGDQAVDQKDHLFWIKDNRVAHSYVGDSNLDREFNSSDFVAVFTAGRYETGQAAGWAEGDWNGDGLFDSSDFVDAFTDGGYELGPPQAVAAVPEPAGLLTAVIGLLAGVVLRRYF